MKRVLFPLAAFLFICAILFSGSARNSTFTETHQSVIDTIDNNELAHTFSKANAPVSGIHRHSRPFSLSNDNSPGQHNRTQSEHSVKWPSCIETEVQKSVSLILLITSAVEIALTIKKIIYPFHTFS
jgi:hypothetical protein